MIFLRNLFFILLIAQVVIDGNAPVREGESSELQVQVILPESLMEKLEGFEFILDAYKNIVINLSNPSSKNATKLQAVIAEMGRSYKNYGLYVSVPVAQAEIASKLEQLGFKLHDLDINQKRLFYLYDNGRDIPELNYAYTAAAVYIIRINSKTSEKELLVINESQKTIANIIGGISNKGESPEDTAVREVREEVGIDIDKKNLKLVAVLHTVRSDKKSCVEFLYLCDKFSGKPKVDGKEALQYEWVPVSQILSANDTKIFGKSFYSLWKKLLAGTFKNQEEGFNITENKKAYQTFNFIN